MREIDSRNPEKEILVELYYHLLRLYMDGVEMIPKVSSEPTSEPGSQVKEVMERLAEVRNRLGECQRCRLYRHRTNIVFGAGSPTPPVVFVGEGPGAEEDREGLPFVGKAGKLLDKMIYSLGLKRDQVYICNVVKCRPPGNRNPQADEIASCAPFLIQQLDILKPRVICTLGACASQTLLNSRSPISRLRGKVHYWRGIPLIATFHPAYLLRNPSQKRAAWQDLLLLQKYLR